MNLRYMSVNYGCVHSLHFCISHTDLAFFVISHCLRRRWWSLLMSHNITNVFCCHINVPKHFITLSFLLMFPHSHQYPWAIKKDFAQLVQSQPTWNEIKLSVKLLTLQRTGGWSTVFLKQWHTKVSPHRIVMPLAVQIPLVQVKTFR